MREPGAGLLAGAPGGDLWAELVANGRASLGLDGGADAAPRAGIDLAHPQIAGIATEDLACAVATRASASAAAEPAPQA